MLLYSKVTVAERQMGNSASSCPKARSHPAYPVAIGSFQGYGDSKNNGITVASPVGLAVPDLEFCC